MHWRRLDIPGSDACKLRPLTDGWCVEGVAEYGTGSERVRLKYTVEASSDWVTRRAAVRGTAGSATIRLEVERRADGSWLINGEKAASLHGLLDLDLGFTPATNLFPLRRLALEPGESADAAAAWLDESDWTFSLLLQRYERIDDQSYWYQSPSTGYEGTLMVSTDGFVLEYPRLWEAIDER